MRSIPVLIAALTSLLSIGPGDATASRDGGVPILMYHVLSEAPPSAPYPDLYVTPRDFRTQLAWLDRNGYTAVTLRHVWSHWHGRRSLPAKPVVITIDDGFRDTYTVGLPALRAHGWPGVLNLALSHLDVGWGLTEHRMRALIRAGWEIGAHSLTHPDLTTLSGAQLRREVAGPKRMLERRFGIEVDFFCYPGGRFDARVVGEVKDAGYLGATTTREGIARRDEPFTLRRIRVSGADGVAGLAEALGQSR
jgi:peptidoglycan/xylan/chitin deacetylase (PgdA/CDA1 family)